MSNSTPKFIGSNQLLKRNFGNSGFTLMEIIVATTVFVIVVTSVLVLFNFVLRINRQVQATRQASQGSRNFTEILSREIRNGKIDYTSSECNSATYADAQNYTLGIVSYSGDKLCFTLDKASGIKVDGLIVKFSGLTDSVITSVPISLLKYKIPDALSKVKHSLSPE